MTVSSATRRTCSLRKCPIATGCYFQDNYRPVAYRFDLYGVFIEKALTGLLRRNGLFGFIIPHTLLSNDSFQALRSLLAAKVRLYRIVDLGPGAFQDAKNETMLLFFENSAPEATPARPK